MGSWMKSVKSKIPPGGVTERATHLDTPTHVVDLLALDVQAHIARQFSIP
jgi:hypothetical protein